MKMYNVIKLFAVVIGVMLIAACGTSAINGNVDTTRDDPNICVQSDGDWWEMTNGCVDHCGTQGAVCPAVLTEGCSCGEGSCWDGLQCVDGLSAVDDAGIIDTDQEKCEIAEADWIEMSSSCGDRCYMGEDIACAQAFTDGCDCGENECWDGSECVRGIGYNDDTVYCQPDDNGEGCEGVL